MKRGVADLLAFGASLGIMTACSGAVAELEIGQVYCAVIGVDPENPVESSCGRLFELVIAREGGTLESLTILDNDVRFRTMYTLAGAVITDINGDDMPIKSTEAYFALGEKDPEYPEYQQWLVPANNDMARKLVQLDQALAKLGTDTTLPSGQPDYVDVPLCYVETQLRNGQYAYQNNPCDYDVTFFASNGRVAEIITESLGGEATLKWGYAGRWSMVGNVGRPDNMQQFEWLISDKGFPVSERKRDKQEVSFLQQRAYNPNILETQIAYPIYDGAERDTWTEIYRTEIYPIMQRRELLLQHFPNWDEQY